MLTHKELVAKALARPGVKAAYDALEPEYRVIAELLRARQAAGLTQAQVAARMGTTNTVVARLEAAGGKRRHSPSIATLQRYARACGKNLIIRLK